MSPGKENDLKRYFFREFDPGSGRTLAACLTHASRTERIVRSFRTDDDIA